MNTRALLRHIFLIYRGLRIKGYHSLALQIKRLIDLYIQNYRLDPQMVERQFDENFVSFEAKRLFTSILHLIYDELVSPRDLNRMIVDFHAEHFNLDSSAIVIDFQQKDVTFKRLLMEDGVYQESIQLFMSLYDFARQQELILHDEEERVT